MSILSLRMLIQQIILVSFLSSLCMSSAIMAYVSLPCSMSVHTHTWYNLPFVLSEKTFRYKWLVNQNCTRSLSKLKMKNVFIVSWNVRTLQGSNKAIEHRTTLVVCVQKEEDNGIATLSEARLAVCNQLLETDGWYTFFWTGKPREIKRETGAGFAI